MKRRRFLTVTVGVMVLSAGLVVMTDSAGAAPKTKSESTPTQSWDENLPNPSRFTVLTNFGGAAVRDNETGLVWEQAPVPTPHTWSNARFQCTGRATGGRKGWRLPSVHELASLIDPSVASPGPTLPAGDPFTKIQSATYWSATTNAEHPTDAWFVFFGNGLVGVNGKSVTNLVWCVRGGMHAEQY